MEYTIGYYSDGVQDDILALPDTLAARYVVLTRRMVALGPNLGPRHTDAFSDGLFELRLKGVEGCTCPLLHVDWPPHHHAAFIHQENAEDSTQRT